MNNEERLYWDGNGDLHTWLCQNDLHPRPTPKGYSVRCLNRYHDDKSNSAQIFTNDLWWACYACGERHPLVKQSKSMARRSETWGNVRENWLDPYDHGDYRIKRREEGGGVECDYYDYWLTLEPLDAGVRDLPKTLLLQLGWRKLPDNNDLGLPAGIFIPAWDANRSHIPFCQVRHPAGADRRFSFPSGAKPMVFGFESLSRMGKYVPFTEGNSDRATLELAGIPALAIPSAANGALLTNMARWCRKNGKIPVACSDNDKAGSKLLKSLDGVTPYIDMRPLGFKDYNEMYRIKGLAAVKERLSWLAEQ